MFSPDGLLYFAQGPVSQNWVMLPQGSIVDLARHPRAHDVPGQDVVLTGTNIDTYDPRTPYPYLTSTGPFKPFGVKAHKGEVIKGELKCSSGIWWAQPDGSELELLAWGGRNPYGMAFGGDGNLYVSDNDFEEMGDRAVAEDPDRIWRIDKARTPTARRAHPTGTGSPTSAPTGCPSGTSGTCRPRTGRPSPCWRTRRPGPPTRLSGAATLVHDQDGLVLLGRLRPPGAAVRLRVGTLAPLNSPRPEDRDHGFKVISVDVTAGTAEDLSATPRPALPRPRARVGSSGRWTASSPPT